MNIIDLLRKGFGYVLLSMGVSRPATRLKSKPKAKSAPDPESDSPSN